MTVSPMLQRNDDSIQVSATELSITATPWEDWPGSGKNSVFFFGPPASGERFNCWCADENRSGIDCQGADGSGGVTTKSKAAPKGSRLVRHLGINR